MQREGHKYAHKGQHGLVPYSENDATAKGDCIKQRSGFALIVAGVVLLTHASTTQASVQVSEKVESNPQIEEVLNSMLSTPTPESPPVIQIDEQKKLENIKAAATPKPAPKRTTKPKPKVVAVSAPKPAVAASSTTGMVIKETGRAYSSCVVYAKRASGINVGPMSRFGKGNGAKNHPVNSQTPRIGGLVVTYESSVGHLAVVVGIEGGDLILDEANYIPRTHTTGRRLPMNSRLIKGYYN